MGRTIKTNTTQLTYDNGMDTAVYQLESYAAKPASGVTIWSVQGFTKKPFSGFMSTNWIGSPFSALLQFGRVSAKNINKLTQPWNGC